MSSFLNSNFFIALVTFCVGSFAIYLYVKQKSDRKRDAAKLILQEIRYAEQKIRKFREVELYKLYDKVLPTNSWNDNIHLFIKDLKEVQNLDLISDFYAKASYIDTLIATISRQKNNPPIIIAQNLPPRASLRATPASPSAQQIGVSPVAPQRPTIVEISPLSQQILKEVSMSVEFIYNTPVVETLRKISEKKWYQII